MAPTSSHQPSAASEPTRRWPRWLTWALVAIVLLGVFMSYLNPDLMVSMADAVWSCF